MYQDVVQTEQTLHRELFDTVIKKEEISERLARHQVVMVHPVQTLLRSFVHILSLAGFTEGRRKSSVGTSGLDTVAL